MTDFHDEATLASIHVALLDELATQLDLTAGLQDIMVPPLRHEALLYELEGLLAVDAGLDEILPQAPTVRSESQRRNARPMNEAAAAKGSPSGSKQHALILIEAALSDLRDIQHWATGPRTVTYVTDASALEGAEIQLRQLSGGISNGSLSLEGALTMVREAARNVNDFMSEGFPLAVGLAVRRTLERLQQLEVLLPKLFESSGNAMRTSY